MKRLWLALVFALLCLPVWAADSAIENRMIEMASELRCLVCQNETIAASRADFAVDIRALIRQKIAEGHTDEAIREFLVSRYGDYILYRPPLKFTTLLLWFGPVLLLAGGFTILATTLRRRRRMTVDAVLSDADRERADALLQHSQHHGK